jgi:small subunit ribosomal protein S8e
LKTEADEARLNKKRSKKTLEKYIERRKTAKVDHKIEEYFTSGRLFARIGSSPGKCGRADGYVLEGKELEFYLKRMK